MNQRLRGSSHASYPEDVLFVGTVGSRTWLSLFSLVVVSGFLAPLLYFPHAWLFLPYSVPIAGLFLWNIFCIVTNRKWSVTVSPSFITWDHIFFGSPHLVNSPDVVRVLVDTGEPRHQIHLVLRSGGRIRISPGITAWVDNAALIEALRTATNAPVDYVNWGST